MSKTIGEVGIVPTQSAWDIGPYSRLGYDPSVDLLPPTEAYTKGMLAKQQESLFNSRYLDTVSLFGEDVKRIPLPGTNNKKPKASSNLGWML